jgi:WD40 repeat protein
MTEKTSESRLSRYVSATVAGLVVILLSCLFLFSRVDTLDFAQTTPAIHSLSFSPNGELLAAGNGNREILIWNMADLTAAPVVLTGHKHIVSSVAFSPDGMTLASGGDDSKVQLWDLHNPNRAPTILSGRDRDRKNIHTVAFSHDGHWLVSVSKGSVQLWDLRNPSKKPLVITDRQDRAGAFQAAAFSPDDQILAISSYSDVELWHMGMEEAAPLVLSANRGLISTIAFSPDGAVMVSSNVFDETSHWDLRQPDAPVQLQSFRTKGGSTYSVAISPDGALLGYGGVKGAGLFDLAQPDEILFGFPEPNSSGQYQYRVYAVAFSPDGKFFVAGFVDGSVLLWDLTNLEAEPYIVSAATD